MRASSGQIDPQLLSAAYAECACAPYASRTFMVHKCADALGVSAKTLYRTFRDSGFLLPQRAERADRASIELTRLSV